MLQKNSWTRGRVPPIAEPPVAGRGLLSLCYSNRHPDLEDGSISTVSERGRFSDREGERQKHLDHNKTGNVNFSR
jgi:hypothetical protein